MRIYFKTNSVQSTLQKIRLNERMVQPLSHVLSPYSSERGEIHLLLRSSHLFYCLSTNIPSRSSVSSIHPHLLLWKIVWHPSARRRWELSLLTCSRFFALFLLLLAILAILRRSQWVSLWCLISIFLLQTLLSWLLSYPISTKSENWCAVRAQSWLSHSFSSSHLNSIHPSIFPLSLSCRRSFRSLSLSAFFALSSHLRVGRREFSRDNGIRGKPDEELCIVSNR